MRMILFLITFFLLPISIISSSVDSEYQPILPSQIPRDIKLISQNPIARNKNTGEYSIGFCNATAWLSLSNIIPNSKLAYDVKDGYLFSTSSTRGKIQGAKI